MKKKSKKVTHNPETCFRCRLHNLYQELINKHDNEPRFILMSMAEACGAMLSQLDSDDTLIFMHAVHKFAQEDDEEGYWETKH